jgi:hypothetical protein
VNHLEASSPESKDPLSMSAPFKLSALSLSSSLNNGKASDDINVGKLSKLGSENSELRKVWQGVLRECHRADPERTGHVNRNVFIAALQRANLPNVSGNFVLRCFFLFHSLSGNDSRSS